MTDDVLKRAAGALRELGEQGDASARFTRARVMASLHRRRQRRQTRTFVLVPLAAVLVGSSVAAATGGRVPQLFDALGDLLQPAPSDAPVAKPARAKVTAGALRSRAAPPVESAGALEQPPPAPEAVEPAVQPAPSPSPAPARVASRPAATKSRAAAAVDDPGHELYRAAHHAHFALGDAARALAAWDAYLARAPGGRFAIEARYNRAICLVRLARHGEARAALEPFAAGAFGAYRRREAQSLLDAMTSH